MPGCRRLWWMAAVCITVFPHGLSAFAVSLTPEQRRQADALITHLPERVKELPPAPDPQILSTGVKLLSERRNLNQALEEVYPPDTPEARLFSGNDTGDLALKVAEQVSRSRAHRRELTAGVVEKVVDDLIWHYEQQVHEDPLRETLRRNNIALALCILAHPKGVPVLLQALEGDDSDLFRLLHHLPDPRFLPVLGRKVNRLNQGDADFIFQFLSTFGKDAVPTLSLFLKDQDRLIRISAAQTLLRIEHSSCIPPLQEALRAGAFKGDVPVGDPVLDPSRIITHGIQRLRCRTVDKVFTPPILPPDDRQRILGLRRASWRRNRETGTPERERADKAADLLVSLGALALGGLTEEIPIPLSACSTIPSEMFPTHVIDTETLVRIGKPALPALIDALTNSGSMASITLSGLQKLTGQTFGPDYEEWSRWYLQRQ